MPKTSLNKNNFSTWIQMESEGTKLWAEYPDDSNLRAEDTYYFDPDNHQGPGDPFDWRTDGNVPDLIIPAKHFVVEGTLQAMYVVDELHLVASLTYPCNATVPNFTIPLSPPNHVGSFSKHFAFPTQAATTFYVYARDHSCSSSRSNGETLPNVTGSGETKSLTNTLIVPVGDES